MEIMTVTTLDSRREWTRDDLDRLPEGDGLRYEIIDGLLVVNAAPRPRHQMVLAGLYDASEPDARHIWSRCSRHWTSCSTSARCSNPTCSLRAVTSSMTRACANARNSRWRCSRPAVEVSTDS